MCSLRSFAVLCVAFSITSLWAENPTTYFRADDADDYEASVRSIEDRQQGELYTMDWTGDCHLARLFDANCTNSMEMIAAACKLVLNDAPPPKIVTDMGCSAFAATNAAGQQLVGRNFDYRYSMAHVLLHSNRDPAKGRDYASVGMVDAGFAGFDVGSLTNLTDQTRADYPWHAALFPLLCMDGMNDAGFMVTVLSLDARPDAQGGKTRVTEQFVPSHTNIVPTLAIRYLLDHAGSTEQGVAMLTNFNMFAASGPGMDIQANYHFLLSDKSGDTRVVEWLPPAEEGGTWVPFVTHATAVSNFYLADGYGHGSNRWEILRHALARQKGHLEEDDAMNLCRAVSQKKGAEQTSWTHWSVVYNLEKLSANLATLGNYDEIFPYKIKESGGWEFGAPKSARPAVEVNLPTYDQKSSTRKDVVYQYCPSVGTMGQFTLPSKWAGSGVSAVNRMGCTYDVSCRPIHVVYKYKSTRKTSVFYADMSSVAGGTWPDMVVAGLNEYGVAARVIRLRYTGKNGTTTASHGLFSALVNGVTSNATDMAAVLDNGCLPATSDAGVVFADAKGNVAIWPKGAELLEDDASEMFRNSLDLRKGIYETDGKGRGQFDELPGLLRLAATDKTRAIVSMGYGHLDVMLPETNRIWRVALEGADIPQYGVVTEPPAVAHATMKSLTYANGDSIERNNQDRIVAKVGAEMKVTYEAAESGYYFSNGTGTLTQQFTVGETATTPPAETPLEPALKLGKVAQRYPWNGIVDVKYKATNWPAGKAAAIEVTLGGKTETVSLEIAGQGTVKDSVAIDLRALFGETRGEATFKAIVK